MRSKLNCRRVGEGYYILTLILSYLVFYREGEKYYMLQDLEGDNSREKVEGKSLYV